MPTPGNQRQVTAGAHALQRTPFSSVPSYARCTGVRVRYRRGGPRRAYGRIRRADVTFDFTATSGPGGGFAREHFWVPTAPDGTELAFCATRRAADSVLAEAAGQS